MAQKIIWTEPALADLEDIAEYIALDNLPVARKLVGEVFQSVGVLKSFPQSGRAPPELPDSNYREIIAGPCRIFYRIEKNRVFILCVIRSETLLRKFLLQDR